MEWPCLMTGFRFWSRSKLQQLAVNMLLFFFQAERAVTKSDMKFFADNLLRKITAAFSSDLH